MNVQSIFSDNEILELQQAANETGSGGFAQFLRIVQRADAVVKLAAKTAPRRNALSREIGALEDEKAEAQASVAASKADVDQWASRAAEVREAETEHKRLKSELTLLAQDRDLMTGEVGELHALRAALT